MDFLYDGFFLAFVGFPALAFVVGLAAGVLFNRLWAGAVAGAATTIVLVFTVANDSLFAWMPIHAATGFIGGALSYLVRRALTRRGGPSVR